MTIPHAAKYERWPTRLKVRFFWCGAAVTAVGWQVASFCTERVMSRRAEQRDLALTEVVDREGKVPEELLRAVESNRQFREMASRHGVDDVVSPGEYAEMASQALTAPGLGKLRRQ